MPTAEEKEEPALCLQIFRANLAEILEEPSGADFLEVYVALADRLAGWVWGKLSGAYGGLLRHDFTSS